MPLLETLYHLAILAGLLLGLAGVVANLACFDGLRPAAPPSARDAPLVSILVPARNEELNIGACAGSLLAQDYPNCELLVLDDHSTDATGAILGGLAGGGGALRVLAGTPLPPGWTGKGWACHQLAAQARGAFLFFADADTTHAPGTVSAAVAYARERRADLVSAWPALLTATPGERLIIPMIVFLGMVMYPHWLLRFLQNHPHLASRVPAWARRVLGAANGQFMFFTRAAYDRIGGHALVRDHLVEDVALGRAVTARIGQGMRLFNCDSLQFSTVRMYRSFGETWEGFTKNLRAAFEESLAGFLAIGAWQLCGFLLPFVFAVFTPRPLVFAQVAVICLIRVVLTIRFRTSWLSCLLHPVSETLGLAIGLNSWRRSAGGGVSWKGRTYQVAAAARKS
jgi:chlorobactene glucosyltransferase